MRITTLFSRRAVLAIVAVLGLSLLSGKATEAARRAPDISGQWEGVLNAEGFPPTPYSIEIDSPIKKNGKFTGQANFPKQEPVNFTGKIEPNRKVKGKFSGDINGEPIVFTLKVTVARDGQSAEGTFSGKDADGNVVVTGTTTLDKIQPE